MPAEPAPPGPHPEVRRLAPVIHAAFFLLLGASLWRYLLRHPDQPRIPWIIALSIVLALLHLLGPVLGQTTGPESGPERGGGRALRQRAWLAAVVGVWVVLVLLAPSFAWCAVPLFYTGLRTLPPRAAVPLVALLTVFVVLAQLRLAGMAQHEPGQRSAEQQEERRVHHDAEPPGFHGARFVRPVPHPGPASLPARGR